MKIAITSLYLPSGSKIGVGYQVHYLANALVRRDHSVTVYSQTGPSDDSLYDVVVVPSGERLRTFQFAWNLRQYDFSQYDVLNAHGDDWFLWGRRRPRHVHTFHGSCLAEMMHSKTLKDKLRMGALAACEMNSLLVADATVAVSENTRRYIPGVQSIIPCGVNLDAFQPGKVQSDHPTVLFVGTMHGRKRGAMLAEVFEREVRSKVPDAELWAVCEQPVEGPGIRWMGRVALDKLIDLFQRAWVFCLPSTYEGFGVPYIEAMASGTPVVASPNPGANEVLGRGKYGKVAEDADLGGALVELLGDRNLRSTLREAGLERAQQYSWPRICEMYEAVYAG
ncbi:MAG: glycosyltransferase family 4 protein [Capsulimonadaceae bacterium]|nr:glycosyltransferase family 4 protein [Capsulimonadaceae bacterium]